MDDMTVEEMYEQSGLSRLRFFVASKQKTYTITSGTTVTEEPVLNNANDEYEALVTETLADSAVHNTQESTVTQTEPSRNVHTIGRRSRYSLSDSDEQMQEQTCEIASDLSLGQETEVLLDFGDQLFAQHVDRPESSISDIIVCENITNEIDLTNGLFSFVDPIATQSEPVPEPTMEALSENGPTNTGSIQPEEVITISQEQNTEEPLLITVHRGQILQELIEVFLYIDKKCMNIQIDVKMTNGQSEPANDFGGVFRDALSEFWSSFYELYTVGTDYKIPYIRHDITDEKWRAIATVLYVGYRLQGYFPIMLAPAFVEHCLYGKIFSCMQDSFIPFLSDFERSTLLAAKENFQGVQSDDLFDVMESLECKTVITSVNINKIVDSLAHKELIQKPMFVIDSWYNVLSDLMAYDELQRIYEKRRPTPKNVIANLEHSEPDNQMSNIIFGYLKKFLREAAPSQIKRFLRFTTGADMITGHKIKVAFNEATGLMRTPIGRTCGYTVELPRSYDSYPDFRSEMNSVLDSGYWVMDIA